MQDVQERRIEILGRDLFSNIVIYIYVPNHVKVTKVNRIENVIDCEREASLYDDSQDSTVPENHR